MSVRIIANGGKLAFKIVRKQIVPAVVKLSLSIQYGWGLNGGETAFAHLQIRVFIDSSRSALRSSAALFLDVVVLERKRTMR